MPTVQEMAQAHLSNVQKAIMELENQKIQVQQEIDKLKDYLEEGSQTITASNKTESTDGGTIK